MRSLRSKCGKRPSSLPFLCLLCFLTTLALSESYVIKPGTWNFRGHPIAFEEAKVVSLVDATRQKEGKDTRPALARTETSTLEGPSTPIVLLNGFGVGSFHQHRLIHELFDPSGDDATNDEPMSQEQRIYGIDYLGQGQSWPEDCQDGQGPNEADLRYCGQTWVDQVIAFIEQVVLPNEPSDGGPRRRVHIMGNSVGGHLAVFVAAQRPDLVESLALLNATPVWGLNLPGWNGRLPAPRLPKQIGRYLFDRIRDLRTIETYLEAAYYNRDAFDTTLMQQIRNCTEGPGGHAAFASILWSPPVTVGKDAHFYQALSKLDCDVLMLFGRDDPWCRPAFARRMLQHVPSDRVASRYVECTSVGHCPNHEAPIATAQVLHRWWRYSGEERQTSPLFVKSQVQERWGQTTLQERKSDEIQLSLMDRMAVTFV